MNSQLKDKGKGSEQTINIESKSQYSVRKSTVTPDE